MPDTGLTEEFVHQLREEQRRFSEKMINGHPKSYEEYREQVGYCRGLMQAERVLHDVIKMYTQLQDED